MYEEGKKKRDTLMINKLEKAEESVFLGGGGGGGVGVMSCNIDYLSSDLCAINIHTHTHMG